MPDVVTSVVPSAIAVAKPGQQLGVDLAPAMRRQLVAAALLAGDLVALTIVAGILQLGATVAVADTHTHMAKLMLVWIPALCGAQACFGLYGSEHAEPVDRLRRRTLGNATAAAIVLAWLAVAAPPSHFWGFVVIGAALTLLLGHYVEALVRGVLLRRSLWTAPTVLYGPMSACAALARNLVSRPELGLRPVAILADDEGYALSDAAEITDIPVITAGQADVISPRIEVALCASGDLCREKADWLARLPLRQIFIVHDASALQVLNPQLWAMGGLLGVELRSAIHMPRNLRLKRAADLLVAIPLAVLALPVILLFALAVKMVDSGSAFYAQPRIGRNGHIFKVYKLRSMYADAEARLAAHLGADSAARQEWERFFKLSNDPRILPGIGHFIRRSSVDELPQLWNVLRGEMSIVGPRPFPAYHSQCFDAAFQALRTSIPPGLTGLWQVTDRSDGDLAVQKQQDSFYIHNWSFWLDFYVLLQTLPAVLLARGAK
ncbi:exopolysaccharide biosynthesis polyprenyl glycosylphosphotransferase [Bosea psychrotolerans]|uniref:Undecaprenyl-phosphate galactose phosphotransferase WbaP/exopolysaccharide biosynthesis polyprenyl glycosylphosphotransferase n=1 Tax=Bosea psychrotolerans TaxID=1871628 RepID=A0A2S4LYW8_9HYPH|nr:exopolysaccharide biosynthesis polyprenyl glycosylphosphotransferase [Bosea psychrotolerans]POR47549.1 Undecaprenyl-phosphate galactose phosphotransferase WbaP/exopolysaccharide biosynthesis polyprenyl glycosylphosphotransferase [Bosea psychrotolerans]